MIDTCSIVWWSSVALGLCNVVLCQQINCKPKDCIDLKCYRVSTGQDGPHTVYPGIASLPSVTVSCDQTVFGGGWTVWLRRCLQTNDTNFNRTWDEYKNGFGRQEGANSEFYLGNEIVHLLTRNYSSGNGEFRIEAISYNDTSYGLSTDGFSLESEADKYRLRVGKEHDNVNVSTGAMLFIKDRQFTTGIIELCLHRYGRIYWWYNECTHFFLFGRHGNPKIWELKYIFIVDDKNVPISMKRVHMLFRPYGDTRQCDNPCKNGATCEYVATSDTSHCKCPPNHCGAFCEKTCKNKGTCVYDAKTKSEVCQCKSGFTGATCADGVTTTTTPSGDVVMTTTKASGEPKFLPIIGGVISLLALIGLVLFGFFLYGQKKKRKEEEAAREKEEKEKEKEEESTFFPSFFG